MLIEINRFTVRLMEQAIEKYNKEKDKHFPKIQDYEDIIEKALEEYLN